MSSINHKSALCLATAILMFAVGLIPACRRTEMKMEPIGPDVKADLVVFLKKETTDDQINTFVQETIGDRADRGYRSLPGMRRTLLVLVDGHKGYAITFFQDATDAQRKYVRSRIDASPLVFKVIENVAPDDIKEVK